MTFKNVLIAAAVPLFLAGCGGAAAGGNEELSWRWMLEGEPGSGGDSVWVGKHVLYPSDGNGGIAYVSGTGEDACKEFRYSFDGRRPAAAPLSEGDCLMFSVPAGDMGKGTFIGFDATLGGDADSPGRYRIEYLDRTGWKNTGITYAGSGDISTGPGDKDTYQYATVLSTFRLDAPPVDGRLKIRCVAEGGSACDGTAMKEGGTVVFPDFGFVAAEIKSLGTREPADTLRVLMLGNSFTYFYGSPFMLKEIAWREGLALDIRANLKGGQTFGDHLSLSLSKAAVKEGGYDFAIIQDQSQNPARYSSNPEKYGSVLENFKALVSEIRKYSPECQIILDRTWAYPGGNSGGFGDYEVFDSLLADGAEKMAMSGEGTLIAPVGEAFTECRERFPEIELYCDDRKHPSEAGAYLKACVEYSVLAGKSFGRYPDDCRLPAEIAARLRSIAEDVTE